MTWADLIPVIAKEGLEVAEILWQKWRAGQAPTQADWDQLKAEKKRKAVVLMTTKLIENGIDPASEKGQELIRLATS